MKKENMKSIAIVLAVLAIATFMVGTMAAMETSFNLVAEGEVFIDEKYRSETQNGLPYAAGAYDHSAFIVGAYDLDYTHALNVGESIETETSLKYVGSEDEMISQLLLEESFKKTIIASSLGVDNSSDTRSYSSGVGFNALATYMDFESATVVSDTEMAYAVDTKGMGSMQYISAEYEASGDTNGTWVIRAFDEDARAHGTWLFEGETVNEAENFPATFEDLVEEEEEEADERLCPFGLGWE